jgi:hypothetical protein
VLQETLPTLTITDFEDIEWGMLRLFLNKLLFQPSREDDLLQAVSPSLVMRAPE